MFFKNFKTAEKALKELDGKLFAGLKISKKLHSKRVGKMYIYTRNEWRRSVLGRTIKAWHYNQSSFENGKYDD
jgi:hypothetical protein